MQLFCDESGNTGTDLLNADQPVFALASTNLSASISAELIVPLLRQGQAEAKYSKLKGTRTGQEALLKFFSSPDLSAQTTKVMLADKRYYLITHIVDKLIEPPLYEMGQDLYAGDAHVGLVNVWYYAGHTIFTNGHWDKIQRAFLKAIRERTPAAFANFDAVLAKAMDHVPYESRDFATGLRLAHGRLNEFLGVYKDFEVFDPAVDIFIDLINKWMADYPGQLQITHDRSKPLRRNEPFLRTLMKPLAPQTIGYGDRQAELPLRVSHLEFADSILHPQLQVADLVAGAAVDCLLAWSGKRHQSGYHEAMKESRLADMVVGGMLPSTTIERKNEPRPGEKNLVDGSTDFLKKAGYFDA